PAKQKINQELMALYRERGVNPAGGCVPMILTFPILFTMWALLSTAIELRGAPFFGWIQDLTAHDPYFVTPIFMGATTVRKQRIAKASELGAKRQTSAMPNDATTKPIVEFLDRFAAALGVTTPVDVEDSADGPRLNLSGDEAEILVRYRGEALKALQHVVD